MAEPGPLIAPGPARTPAPSDAATRPRGRSGPDGPPRRERARRPTLALVTDNIHLGVGATLWAGAVAAAERGDANLVALPGGALRPGSPRNALYDLIAPDRLDGVVCWTSTLNLPAVGEGARWLLRRLRPLPVVSLNQGLEGHEALLLDGDAGMREAVGHLVEDHGRRRPACVRGPLTNPVSFDRYRAYTHALARHRIPLDHALVTEAADFGGGAGARAMRVLLDIRRLRPGRDFDAVVACSDVLAADVLRCLTGRGIRVPEDVAVVGFNDSVEARLTDPPLTSVSLPFTELGSLAVETLLARLRGTPPPVRTAVPGALVTRRSCGCHSPLVVQGAVDAAATAAAAAAEGPPGAGVSGDPFGDCPGNAAELDAAFHADVAATPGFEAPGAFLPLLEAVLARAVGDADDARAWDAALLRARRLALPRLPDDARGCGERLLGQARLMVADKSRRLLEYARWADEQEARRLRELGTALTTATDTDALTGVLAERLPAMGVRGCRLVLYENGDGTGAVRPVPTREERAATVTGRPPSTGPHPGEPPTGAASHTGASHAAEPHTGASGTAEPRTRASHAGASHTAEPHTGPPHTGTSSHAAEPHTAASDTAEPRTAASDTGGPHTGTPVGTSRTAGPHTGAPYAGASHAARPRTEASQRARAHAEQPRSGATPPGERNAGEPSVTEPDTAQAFTRAPRTAEDHTAQAGVGEPHAQVPHTANAPAAEPRRGGPPAGEPGTGGRSGRGQRSEEPPAGDTRTREGATGVPQAGERYGAGPGTGEARSGEPCGGGGQGDEVAVAAPGPAAGALRYAPVPPPGEDRRFTLVAEPLHLGAERLGFALFDAGSREGAATRGALYRALGDQVSAALKGIRLLDEVQRARDAAERASRLKTRLLDNATDELRTPVEEILRRTAAGAPAGADPSEVLRTVHADADRLLGIVDDLLDLSRSEIDALDLSRQLLDPRPLLAEAFAEVAGGGPGPSRTPVRTAHAARTAVPPPAGLRLPRRLPAICADPARLRQILVALLTAAAGPPGGAAGVALSAQVRPPVLRVRVEGPGLAVSREDAERLLEPFASAAPGTRLGPAVARRLAVLHGGSVSLCEASGRSGFRLELPLPTPADAPCPVPGLADGPPRRTLYVASSAALHDTDPLGDPDGPGDPGNLGHSGTPGTPGTRSARSARDPDPDPDPGDPGTRSARAPGAGAAPAPRPPRP
ncbi:substrate-binding domain-containing protein, partial [Streptomyces fragilis]